MGAVNRLLKLKHCPQEASLWNCLQEMKTDALRFKRQHPIGPYVVDFCCPSFKVVIEITKDMGAVQPPDAYDRMRITYLEGLGYKVLRFAQTDPLEHGEKIISSIRNCIASLQQTN